MGSGAAPRPRGVERCPRPGRAAGAGAGAGKGRGRPRRVSSLLPFPFLLPSFGLSCIRPPVRPSVRSSLLLPHILVILYFSCFLSSCLSLPFAYILWFWVCVIFSFCLSVIFLSFSDSSSLSSFYFSLFLFLFLFRLFFCFCFLFSLSLSQPHPSPSQASPLLHATRLTPARSLYLPIVPPSPGLRGRPSLQGGQSPRVSHRAWGDRT